MEWQVVLICFLVELVLVSYCAYNSLGATLKEGQDPKLWACYWIVYSSLFFIIPFEKFFYLRIALSIIFSLPAFKLSKTMCKGINKNKEKFLTGKAKIKGFATNFIAKKGLIPLKAQKKE